MKVTYVLVLPAAIILAISAHAAKKPDPRGDYARRQRLQKSAETWLRREVLPTLKARSGLESIHDYGVAVTESPAVLPPDLGGPLPTSPVSVNVKVFFSGSAYDYRWGSRAVHCEAAQRLTAKNNGFGRGESIRAGQALRAPIACASGYIPHAGDYGSYDWR